jgi:hypothetical protein
MNGGHCGGGGRCVAGPVQNGPARAAFWKGFVADRCHYPAAQLLRSQLRHAEFTDFCQCGCNSFELRVDPDFRRPLLQARRDTRRAAHASIFIACFWLADEKTLEITLFADGYGHLAGVDVDCCANSFPVPGDVLVSGPPFHTWAAEGLFLEP